MNETTEDYLENLTMALGHLVFKTNKKGIATDNQIIAAFNTAFAHENKTESIKFLNLIKSCTIEVDLAIDNQEDTSNLYIDNGFEDRDDYIGYLAIHHNVPLELVEALAETLGPEEDFDALPIALADFNV